MVISEEIGRGGEGNLSSHDNLLSDFKVGANDVTYEFNYLEI